jgi:endogenous inhibitor of DNA gyrase (YacG/DUF329 family)
MASMVRCPTCGRPVEWSEGSTYRPFCSDRCRLIDLGAWLSEERRIPDESSTPRDGDGQGEHGDRPKDA